MIGPYTIERVGETLHIRVPMALGAVLAALDVPDLRASHERELRQLLDTVASDVYEIATIIRQEPEHGVVKWFDESLGYGFIRGWDRQDIFVHHRQVTGTGYRALTKGQRVTFKRRLGTRTYEALDVTPVEEDV